MAKDKAPKPACLADGTCLYFGWDRLRRSCFHPEDPKHLVAVQARCNQFVSDEIKVGPAQSPWWRPKLTVEEFRMEMLRMAASGGILQEGV